VDDENARKGYCLYKMGCKGPVTYNACSVVKWNEGTSYPIQSGHGCIGCSEAGFWITALLPASAVIPRFRHREHGRHRRHGSGSATLAGVTAHAVVTNIRKHKVIAEVHAEEHKES